VGKDVSSASKYQGGRSSTKYPVCKDGVSTDVSSAKKRVGRNIFSAKQIASEDAPVRKYSVCKDGFSADVSSAKKEAVGIFSEQKKLPVRMFQHKIFSQ
jgi:hypothetical protein